MKRHRIAPGASGDWRWHYVYPTLFVLFWSAGYAFAKMGLSHAGIATLLMLRYGLIVLVLAPLLAILRPPLPTTLRDWINVAVVGLLIQVVFFGFTWTALVLGVSAGTAALIFSLQPILVGLLAPHLAQEHVGVRRWAGLGLGLVGAAIVILARSSIEATSVRGILFSVVAVLGMTAATLYEKRFGVVQHPVTANLIQCGVGFVVFLPLAFAGGGLQVSWSKELFIALAYLVFVNSLITITLLLAMIRRREAARVSALFFLVPPAAALIAWLLLGEVMPLVAWAGIGLAAIGVAIASRPDTKTAAVLSD